MYVLYSVYSMYVCICIYIVYSKCVKHKNVNSKCTHRQIT
jgi:hypothetical protein